MSTGRKRSMIATNLRRTKGMSWKEFKRSKQERQLRKNLFEHKLHEKTTAMHKELGMSAEELQADPSPAQIEKSVTISLAVAGSILDNAQSLELRTYLAGQIARAAAIFCIDEVVIFGDQPSNQANWTADEKAHNKARNKKTLSQMATILRYCECPQYIRKTLFPLQKELKYAGVLNPLECPHHLKEFDMFPFREGLVVDKTDEKTNTSFVDVGLAELIRIDQKLSPGLRVTVRLNQPDKTKKNHGKVVSPQTPTIKTGKYWGYSVRIAKKLSKVFSECPFPGGYDLKIGTSERGLCVDQVYLKEFKHAVIVVGGLDGLELAVDSDKTCKVKDPSQLFDYYLNTCPNQGTRTIRSEEAVLISLAAIRPKFLETLGNF